MRAGTTKRRVKSREVCDEAGSLRCYVLTTHRNQDIEVILDPNRADCIDVVKRPSRLTEEQARCLVSILMYAFKLTPLTPRV